ncbi:hypothetical protein O159_11930 [Leifsonia xyli subsp. cynodontis DSM 46306]|uniref:PH domain-containing protein n=1 Tax=Leifsonia xyli subsp. cynodontis DSM 46306 TaxID=1389489 RepID=U3PCN1_LEIXC|nr:hypothetical protein [Leifsonia xyli]AGW41278.1 hypothetical protein O159_11930 [Leifsonia xyli subsp. cynodontis DSM 46306]
MDKLLPVLGTLAVVALAFALALAGWRRRVRRDALAGGGYPAPETPAASAATADVLYVATTRAGEHLERLALPGLAYRGKGTVDVSSDGLCLVVAGEQPVFIPASALTGTGPASVAIDRAVEPGGLLRVGWTTSGGVPSDSYFRVVDPALRGSLTVAIDRILPGSASPADTSESEE